MNLQIDELELSYPVKQIASILMSKGGICEQIPGTKIYMITFRRKEYFFSYDMSSGVPYMYGVIFTPLYFWRQIILSLKMKFSKTKPLHTNSVSIFVTKDGCYNALLETNVIIKGDGKSTIRALISKENMKRINNPVKTISPIHSRSTELTLRKILPKNTVFKVNGAVDYGEVTKQIDASYITVAKKILFALPRLSYITIKIYTKDISSKQKHTIDMCDLTGGMNVFFPAINGNTTRNAGEKIVDLMVHV